MAPPSSSAEGLASPMGKPSVASPGGPVTPQKGLPKAVVAARASLEQQGIQLSRLDSKTLYSALDSKTINSIASGFVVG